LSRDGETAVRSARSQERVEEWALVLSAEGLSPAVRSGGGRFALVLPEAQVERALEILAAYEQENPPAAEEEEPAAPATRRRGAALATSLLLLGFFLVTGPSAPGNPWFDAGSANAQRIRDGETWRVVTALTLHADLAHVGANAIMAFFLVGAVCNALGSGAGLAAVLLTGIAGNWINAQLHPSFHSSVGASTAVFGALGLLTGPAVSRRWRRGRRRGRLLAPLGAGLGVIAMLGVGGERTDLWAHLFGFGAGVLLGLPLALSAPRVPGPATQLACGALAVAVVLGSWELALTR
jgi:rhomboid protease GluP